MKVPLVRCDQVNGRCSAFHGRLERDPVARRQRLILILSLKGRRHDRPGVPAAQAGRDVDGPGRPGRRIWRDAHLRGPAAVLRRNSSAAQAVSRMADQEQRHLNRFNALMAERGVRPTALQPCGHVAGFALGAATALMSEKAAMACTEAVETENRPHYGSSLRSSAEDDRSLPPTSPNSSAEELEHRDVAREPGGRSGRLPAADRRIRAGCRVAIGLSKRI
jgi:ubiquinone biosynthesis monooxygenase Coq7